MRVSEPPQVVAIQIGRGPAEPPDRSPGIGRGDAFIVTVLLHVPSYCYIVRTNEHADVREWLLESPARPCGPGRVCIPDDGGALTLREFLPDDSLCLLISPRRRLVTDCVTSGRGDDDEADDDGNVAEGAAAGSDKSEKQAPPPPPPRERKEKSPGSRPTPIFLPLPLRRRDDA